MTAARGLAVMVAYYAPPAVGIAVNRLVGMLRHLPEQGWDPVLVAPASVHYHRGERSPSAPDPLEGVRVVRVPNPEPSRWLRRLAGAGEDAPPEGGIQELRPAEVGWVGRRLRGLVHTWLYVPDAQLLWAPRAGRAAAEVLRQGAGRPRVLFSSCDPFSCHLAARRAAGEVGTPWVAEYRDPWSVGPALFGVRHPVRAQIDRRLDHEVTSRARHIVVTAETTRQEFLDGFPHLGEDDVTVVRNGWVPASSGASASPPGPDEPLRLVWAGALVDSTWAVPVLEALRRLHDEQPGAVELDVYGPEEPWVEAMASASPGCVRLRGIIPASEVMGKLTAASALVLLLPTVSRTVPGKLYEYLGSRRPILATLPRHSEAARLAAEHGDPRVVDPSTADAVEAAIRRLLAEHRAGELQGARVDAERVAGLTRAAQTARLARVFDELAR